MSLALNLPEGGEAEIARIRAEKGIAPTPAPSPPRSDRSGAKQWRNAARAFADERDRQEALGPKSVDQLLSYASKLARGDEIDLDELHAATAWTRPRFLAALAEARRLERWPYRPARPKPQPATRRVVPEPRRNVDGMTIWPDPPARPSVLKPPDPEPAKPEPTKPHQTPPTPARPNQETARMSATVATTATTTRPTTPPPPARPMLYAKGSPPSISPALQETLKAADVVQVDGKVDVEQIAKRLGISPGNASVRISGLRKAGMWPYESARAPGERKTPQKGISKKRPPVEPSAKPLTPHESLAPSKPKPPKSKPAPEPAPSFPEADTDPTPMPPSTNIVTQIFDAIRPAPAQMAATSLDDIRQLLAAQTAILDNLDGMRPSVRAGVVRWIVDNQASLVGGPTS